MPTRRKTADELRLHGSASQGRTRSVPKVTPAAGLTMPRGLDTHGKRFWKRYRDLLGPDGANVLAEADGLGLEVMARLYSVFVQAAEDVRTRGPLVEGYRGGMVKNPALQLMRDSQAALYKWAVQFGLSPAARRAVDTVPAQDTPSEFELFLARGRANGTK